MPHPLLVASPYLFVGTRAWYLNFSVASEGDTANRATVAFAPRKLPGPGESARVLSAPGFDLQSLPGDDALEDAGLRVNEVQRLSVAPCVVRRSLEMGRARDRR